MNNKDLVLTAITDVFVKRDVSAFDKYFGENYIQHNPHFPNGTDFLKQVVPAFSSTFKYEPGVVTENGDIVMVHGRYEDWNGQNMIAVDIFRVENGKIVEHWDVMQEEITADKTASGNAMFPI